MNMLQFASVGQRTGQNAEVFVKSVAMYDNPAAMEPLLPSDGDRDLSELAAELVRRAARLTGCLHPATKRQVQELVRTMNSYYSNLIEGHNTHPADIEKALRRDYSQDSAKRALQIESTAHIDVQLLIEDRLRREPDSAICADEFLRWIHRELYQRFPDEFRVVKTKSGGQDTVHPGDLRTCEVEVGRHLAPTYRSLPKFLARFGDVYRPEALDPLKRVIACAASHHRLAWIHPFLDGNGRVTRLFTHAYLIQCKTDGHGLWTVTRGLSRRRDQYMAALMRADEGRHDDYDGRGNLSHESLVHFCRFFLETALDQVDFMGTLLDLDAMQQRIHRFGERWVTLEKSPTEVPELLRECFLRGEIARGDAAMILRKPERTARRLLVELIKKGLLDSTGPGEPVRLGLPTHAVGYYFPRLYPEGVELSDPPATQPA